MLISELSFIQAGLSFLSLATKRILTIVQSTSVTLISTITLIPGVSLFAYPATGLGAQGKSDYVLFFHV